jgi:hypothetical protein
MRSAAALLLTALSLASLIPARAFAESEWDRAEIAGSASLQAGNAAIVPLVVHLLHRDGRPAASGIAVRASMTAGSAGFRTPAQRSFDATTDASGAIELPLAVTNANGSLTILLASGEATSELHLSVVAAPKRPFVVGFATVGAGPVPGWIEAPDNAPSGTNTRRGTIALYGNGQIAKNTTLAFAYDSANALAQSQTAGPFTDNPNDRPYPIYGDQSTRYDDALSQNRIFARVQNGRSSAMWGEFYAQAAPPGAAGGYSVLVNGANAIVQGNALSLGAFTARNDVAYARQVISPTGLAIANTMLAPDIVVGSDVVTLVHLDRRTGAILEQQPLVRGSDYVLDYASGLLRFTNVILPYDSQLNPQIVVVQYQYGGPGAHSTMLGGEGTLRFGAADKGRLDGWYLNDSIGSGNLTLLGESLSGSSSASSWAISHEHSSGFLPITQLQYGTAGDSYKATFTARTANAKYRFDFSNTSAAYDNPFGAYSEPGSQALDADALFHVSRISDVDAGYQSARNALPATLGSDAVSNADTQASLTLRVHPNKRFSYHLGLDGDWANSNGTVNPALLFNDSTVTQNPIADNTFFPPFLTPVQYYPGSGNAVMADYGLDWHFTDRAGIQLSRLSPLGASLDPYDPPQTQAEFDLDVGAHGKAFVRQLWQRNSIQALAGSQAVPTYASTASSSTSIGFEQQSGPMTFESGYSVDHTADGTDLFDAMGVRGRVLATKYLQLDGFAQVGEQLYSSYGPSTTAQSPYFVALGTAVDYSRDAFHATGQVQVRTGYNSGSTTQLGAAGPISPAVSLFGSFSGSFTQAVQSQEGRFGLSYRPSRNDRYVTLFSVDQYRSNLTNYDAYTTNVAQIEELYRSSTRTEWSASYAYKLTGDAFFAPHTSILGMSVDQRIGPRFDLGSEVHWSAQPPAGETNATGFALEAGYRLGSSMRAAIGYNFSGFADPSTAINPTHRGVYVTFTSYIDRIFGWGKEPR